MKVDHPCELRNTKCLKPRTYVTATTGLPDSAGAAVLTAQRLSNRCVMEIRCPPQPRRQRTEKLIQTLRELNEDLLDEGDKIINHF